MMDYGLGFMQVDPTGDFYGSYSLLDSPGHNSHSSPKNFEHGTETMDVEVDQDIVADDGSTEEESVMDDNDLAAAAECETDWEPKPPTLPSSYDIQDPSEEQELDLADSIQLPPYLPSTPLCSAQFKEPTITHYPNPMAGAPILQNAQGESDFKLYRSQVESSTEHLWAPFISEIDWKVAHGQKCEGPAPVP
jgi:hypothetical protein